jgi:hypothetical protein
MIMENKYFDNVLLAQYFVTGVPLQVYVNGEYLKIVEYDDIDDTHFGLGMRKNGAMVPFDYRFIEHIMIGNNKYTIADVNKAMRADATGGEETPSKETPEKETGEEEKAPKESIKRKNMTKLTEKLGLSQVSEPYTFQVGDMIHNIGQGPHFGSKGIISGMEDGEAGMIIRYNVTNAGNGFKPGDSVSVPFDQLSLMNLTGEPEDEFSLEDEEEDFMGFGDDEGMYDEEAWEEGEWDEEEDDEFEDEDWAFDEDEEEDDLF